MMEQNNDWQQIVLKQWPKLKGRLSRLRGTNLEIAEFGVRRHLKFCDKSEVAADLDAIREIIDDALIGKSIAKSNEDEINNNKKLKENL